MNTLGRSIYIFRTNVHKASLRMKRKRRFLIFNSYKKILYGRALPFHFIRVSHFQSRKIILLHATLDHAQDSFKTQILNSYSPFFLKTSPLFNIYCCFNSGQVTHGQSCAISRCGMLERTDPVNIRLILRLQSTTNISILPKNQLHQPQLFTSLSHFNRFLSFLVGSLQNPWRKPLRGHPSTYRRGPFPLNACRQGIPAFSNLWDLFSVKSTFICIFLPCWWSSLRFGLLLLCFVEKSIWQCSSTDGFQLFLIW